MVVELGFARRDQETENQGCESHDDADHHPDGVERFESPMVILEAGLEPHAGPTPANQQDEDERCPQEFHHLGTWMRG